MLVHVKPVYCAISEMKGQTSSLRKVHLTCSLILFFVHVPSSNMEVAGFMTCSAASHQGAITTFWLHFWEPPWRPSLHIQTLNPQRTNKWRLWLYGLLGPDIHVSCCSNKTCRLDAGASSRSRTSAICPPETQTRGDTVSLSLTHIQVYKFTLHWDIFNRH